MSDAGVGGWADDPLSTSAEDALGRLPFAEKVASLIDANHSDKSSIVYGLTGPWGSGKTSLLKMITESLETRGQQWTVRRFTPWAADSEDEVVGEFLAVVASVLPESKAQSVRRSLRKLATVAAPAVKALPGGDAMHEVGTKAQQTWLAEPPWQDRFDAAASEISDAGVRLLVIADDIDRLHPAELMTLLKVIRLLGRFPGVDYLLAYDDETITDVLAAGPLTSGKPERARRFMEKIVQYPIAIPPVQRVHLLRRIREGLDAIYKEHHRTLDDPHQRAEALGEMLIGRLNTLRSVDRFLAQVRLYLPMIDPGDVDDTDLLILTFIRLHYPEMYAALPDWKAHLTRSSPTATLFIDDKIDKSETDITPLLALVPERERDGARSVLMQVFPTLSKFGAGFERKRAHNSRYFDRYFAFDITEDDVSDVLVAKAVNDMAQAIQSPETQRLDRLVESDDAAIATNAVHRLRESIEDADSETITVDLIRAVASYIEKTKTSSHLFFSPRQAAINMLALLLERAPTIDDLGPSLMSACNSSVDLLKAIGYSLRGGVDPTQSDLGRTVAERLVDDIVSHILQRDDADYAFMFRTAIGMISTFGLHDELQGKIAEAIATKAASPGDVAARCVGLASSSNLPRMLNDFDSEMFAALQIQWEHEETPLEQRPDIDDLSWENRKRFAAWALTNGIREID